MHLMDIASKTREIYRKKKLAGKDKKHLRYQINANDYLKEFFLYRT